MTAHATARTNYNSLKQIQEYHPGKYYFELGLLPWDPADMITDPEFALYDDYICKPNLAPYINRIQYICLYNRT